MPIYECARLGGHELGLLRVNAPLEEANDYQGNAYYRADCDFDDPSTVEACYLARYGLLADVAGSSVFPWFSVSYGGSARPAEGRRDSLRRSIYRELLFVVFVWFGQMYVCGREIHFADGHVG